MSEKPKSVEVGQVWRCDDEAADKRLRGMEFTITAVFDGEERFSNKWRDGLYGSGGYSWLLSRCTLLGGPTPTPGEGKGMEADEQGWPVRCISCGKDKDGNVYVCDECEDRGEWKSLMRAWNAGSRDFPRPARPAPTPSPTPNIEVTRDNKAATAAPAPIYGRMVGETRDANGVPLTALQAIQARKPPEPWVPSADEWDLLPDAGR